MILTKKGKQPNEVCSIEFHSVTKYMWSYQIQKVFKLPTYSRQCQFSSVQSLGHVWLFTIPWTSAHQSFLSITNSGVYSNSCPLSQWCLPAISSSVIPFSFHLQSFPASGSFQMSQFFALGGQSTGVSASTSVLPINIQDWFPLGWTG